MGPPEKTPFYTSAFQEFPDQFSDDQIKSLQTRAKEIISEQVVKMSFFVIFTHTYLNLYPSWMEIEHWHTGLCIHGSISIQVRNLLIFLLYLQAISPKK